ncbi:MAG: sulfatase [Caldilineaceae bacterium]
MDFLRRKLLQISTFGLALSMFPPLRLQALKSYSVTERSLTASPNIVLIMVDALRSDHLSFHGYLRDTTPNLNRWMAQEGIDFPHTFSTAPWTYPANASILSGLLPSLVGASWNFSTNPIDEHVQLLAQYLHKEGYQTAGFVTPYVFQKRFGFGRGFDHYDDSLTTRPTSNKGTAHEVNQLALDWLFANRTLNSTQPLFLYLYHFDPHSWYNAPSPYSDLYDPTYQGELTAEIYKDGQDTTEGKLALTERDKAHLIALYDGEIAYWDNEFGRFMTNLEQNGFLQNTLIVVCGDHGEMFGEHNCWVHGSMLYDEVLRVPLLMRYDGVINKGNTFSHRVQNMDVLPTLLAYANVAIPESLHGLNLRPWIEDPQKEYERIIFSEVGGNSDLWFAPNNPIHAIRKDEWKLIRQFNDSLTSELFRPENASIFEVEDEVLKYPEIVNQLTRILTSQFFPYPVSLPLLHYGSSIASSRS